MRNRKYFIFVIACSTLLMLVIGVYAKAATQEQRQTFSKIFYTLNDDDKRKASTEFFNSFETLTSPTPLELDAFATIHNIDSAALSALMKPEVELGRNFIATNDASGFRKGGTYNFAKFSDARIGLSEDDQGDAILLIEGVGVSADWLAVAKIPSDCRGKNCLILSRDGSIRVNSRTATYLDTSKMKQLGLGTLGPVTLHATSAAGNFVWKHDTNKFVVVSGEDFQRMKSIGSIPPKKHVINMGGVSTGVNGNGAVTYKGKHFGQLRSPGEGP